MFSRIFYQYMLFPFEDKNSQSAIVISMKIAKISIPATSASCVCQYWPVHSSSDLLRFSEFTWELVYRLESEDRPARMQRRGGYPESFGNVGSKQRSIIVREPERRSIQSSSIKTQDVRLSLVEPSKPWKRHREGESKGLVEPRSRCREIFHAELTCSTI